MLQTQIFILTEYFFKAGLKSKEEKAECLRSEAKAFQRAAKTMATPFVWNPLQHSLPPGCGIRGPGRSVGSKPRSSDVYHKKLSIK